jgi:GNAT superfamily N-acetyltransferase
VRLDRAIGCTGSAWFEGGARTESNAAERGERSQLALLGAADAPVVLRRATAADVEAVVRLVAADQLGATREDVRDLTAYQRAFDAVDADPAQLLVVLDHAGEVVGTMQLTTLPGLSRRGATRLQLEAVRVAASHRGQRLGEEMVRWAVQHARDTGCSLVQLTTDKSRVDAHRFYERLGFTASHEGYKLTL